MQKFVCIHGHFYQPPRENPWTGKVEVEKSAHPFHDWNERITSECYAPNAVSSLKGRKGRAETVNNYSWISHDFGPTLLRWMEYQHPEVHKAILEADRASEERFGGHGSAMAQVYNHMIVPLATAENKRIQVRWGAQDFERRFGRYPEGMWLSETAVDLASLETLAEAEIKFTVLSPDQAAGVRKLGDLDWTDVSGGRIDTRRAYLCRLPSGRSIALFFFDKGVSTNLAFGDLLESGDAYSQMLLGRFSDTEEPQLVNVATDGESYGHHRKNGQLALTTCLSNIERSKGAVVTDYGLFLSVVPPSYEVRILEGTSWSCPHGVERWRSDCGCGSEIRAGFNQAWRGPLRSSLDWLGERLAQVYLEEGLRTFADPRSTQQDFASVAMNRKEDVKKYLAARMKPGQPIERGAELLSMVECSALMFASCAWFWEDISRVETVQMLRFASRGIQLARDLGGVELEPEFERLLSSAVPNDKRFRTGADIYDRLARKTGPP